MDSILVRASLITLAVGLATAGCDTHKGNEYDRLVPVPVNLGEAADELQTGPKTGKKAAPKQPAKPSEPPAEKPTAKAETDILPTGMTDKLPGEQIAVDDTPAAPPPARSDVKDKKTRLKIAMADGVIQCSEVISHIVTIQNQAESSNPVMVQQLVTACQMQGWSPEARKCVIMADKPEDMLGCRMLPAQSKPPELPGPDCTRVIANLIATLEASPHIPPQQKQQLTTRREQYLKVKGEECRFRWPEKLRECILQASDHREVMGCQRKIAGG